LFEVTFPIELAFDPVSADDPLLGVTGHRLPADRHLAVQAIPHESGRFGQESLFSDDDVLLRLESIRSFHFIQDLLALRQIQARQVVAEQESGVLGKIVVDEAERGNLLSCGQDRLDRVCFQVDADLYLEIARQGRFLRLDDGHLFLERRPEGWSGLRAIFLTAHDEDRLTDQQVRLRDPLSQICRYGDKRISQAGEILLAAHAAFGRISECLISKFVEAGFVHPQGRKLGRCKRGFFIEFADSADFRCRERTAQAGTRSSQLFSQQCARAIDDAIQLVSLIGYPVSGRNHMDQPLVRGLPDRLDVDVGRNGRHFFAAACLQQFGCSSFQDAQGLLLTFQVWHGRPTGSQQPDAAL